MDHVMRTTSNGLSSVQVGQARRTYGENRVQKQKRSSFIVKFFKSFNDPIIRILLGALAINFLFFFRTFDIYETVGIVAAILCSTLISAISERGGERAFEKLQEQMEGQQCYVRRDGQTCRVPVCDVVVGDLVLIEAGEQIPADGMLVAGHLTVDQSPLNGEGEEVEKNVTSGVGNEGDLHDPGQVFRGSLVRNGEGIMQVLRVGAKTIYGGISTQLQEEHRPSPLKMRLSKLAKQMSVVGYGAALLVAFSYLVNVIFIDAGSLFAGFARMKDLSFLLPQLIRALALATTVIVVAVPEGLPMMISVVLASNMKRMQRENVLVRSAVGIETAGSMNLLFTDKTGTLTLGRPQVAHLILGDGSKVTVEELRKYPALLELYIKNARCNTMSTIVSGRAAGGNGTDRAILESVANFPKPMAHVEEKQPFDSVRKCSSARIDGVYYIKGAWEILFRRAQRCYQKDGTKAEILRRGVLQQRLREETEKAMRVLAVCTREANGSECLLCFICIRDGLRPRARAAVQQLRGAGIQVVMMTGDNRQTAYAIARDAGILDSKDDVVLDSDELAGYSDQEVKRLLPHLRVVARALPSDKSRLVRVAQQAGLVVGMTGDGINDAPSLKGADVGFAMGSGTEVAKEAGDIVILDDNISSIARAVLYGRTIFKSIRKFILFQLTTNFSAVAISIICPFLGIDSPVTVLQMLWINMIMDTFGSLAFAGEAPLTEYMCEPPKPRDEKILNRYMVKRMIFGAGYIITLALSFITSSRMQEYYGFFDHPLPFLCAFFTLFIFADLSNCFSARTTRLNPFSSLRQNRTFVIIMSMIICVQLCIIYFGGAVFRTTPLSPTQFLIPFGLALSVIPYNIIVKLFLKKQGGV